MNASRSSWHYRMYVRTAKPPSQDPSRCEYWSEVVIGVVFAISGVIGVLAGIAFMTAVVANGSVFPTALTAFLGSLSIVLIVLGISLFDQATDLLKGPKARLKNALRCDEKMAFTD